MAAGDLQHVPAAVSGKHGLPAAVARSQVCVHRRAPQLNAQVMEERSDLGVEHT